MNYDYVLRKLRKAEFDIEKAYNSLKEYDNTYLKKELSKCRVAILNLDETISELEIDLEIWREKENEQLH